MGDFLRSIASSLSGVLTSSYPLISVKSTVDGKVYRVRALADRQEAADMLARLRLKLTALCDDLERKYPDKPQVKQIVRNFRSDPNRFLEATPDSSHTSYSVNKGEEIHLCLRQRSAGDETLVNENVMTFVALHELAHVCTESVGHGPDFWFNFSWLLKEAEARGIYAYTDFQAQPVSYCGVSITDSPRYDPAKDPFKSSGGTDLQIGTMKKTA